MSQSNFVTYVTGKGDPNTGKWTDLQEFQFELEPGEFSLIWACIQIRALALTKAEEAFPNYVHPEPFNIGGINRTVEIGSAAAIMQGPLLVTSEENTNSPGMIKIIQKGERAGYTWRLHKESGLQAMASLGWLCDISKSRQPPITQATNDVTYSESLMPSNISVKENAAPSGYNKKQITLLQSTMEFMGKILDPIPDIKELWIGVPIVTFGEKIFKTTSKIFNSLPDLEDEERQKFEEMKNMAKATTAEPASE